MLTKTLTATLQKELGAIEIHEEGVALAHVARPKSRKPELLNCDFFPHNDISELGATLKNITAKYALKEIPFNWVLHPKHYRILLIDIPAEVPPSEYKEAAKWQVKDIVDYPLEDLTIDIFAPGDHQKKGMQKLYVIATQHSFLQKTLTIIRNNLPNVIAVDIREFALRNLVRLANRSANKTSEDYTQNEKNLDYEHTGETEAHLHINQDDSLLIIAQKNVLNFARRIPLGLNVIEKQRNITDLTNEIERSLDYYRATFKGSNPNFFLISPPLKNSDINNALLECISTNLTNKVKFAELKDFMHPFPQLNNELKEQCYIAIGGAFRDLGED